MAPRAGKSTPKGGRGKNDTMTPEAEAKIIREVFDYIRTHKKKQSSFKEKMKLNWDQHVVSQLKLLGMAQGDVMEDYAEHQIETGKDENAVARSEARRARRLNTSRRVYAALHDGAQLDFIKLQEADEKARMEAEEEADSPAVRDDSKDETEE